MSHEDERTSPPIDGQNPDELALAGSFNTEAELYEGFRLGYPSSLFDVITEHAELTPEARIVEIGSGTGQATLPLAQRGYDVTAVEPGSELAAITRRKLQPFPKVEVITGSFEEVDLPAENYDLVLAAMSLHWVRENLRFSKPHTLLKPGAHLAILYNWPLATDKMKPFYEALGVIAQRHDFPQGSFQPIEKEGLGIRPSIDTELFEEPSFFVQPVQHLFKPSHDYTGFLASLSAVLVLPEEQQHAFLGEADAFIEENFGERLVIPYASTLALTHKKSDS
jgi:SAM-dependent methyltransferase